MPRVVFTEQLDLQAWLERFGDPLRYTVYQTNKNEIVIEPTKSTQPIRYGYMRCPTVQALNKVVSDLKEKGYTVISCKTYEWATDRDVGGRSSLDDEE